MASVDLGESADTTPPAHPAPPALASGATAQRVAWRIFLLFAAVYFLSYFYRTANAVIAGDLARDLDLDAGQLGLMTSLYFATFSLAQLPIGVGLDRWGPRLVVPLMLSAAVAGSLCFAAAGTFGALALGRALIGLGLAPILPSAFKTFSLWYPPKRVATVSGLLVGIASTGSLVSATPLAWLTRSIGWRAVFAGTAVLLVAGALAFFAGVRNAPPGVTWPVGAASRGGMRAVFGSRRFWRIGPLGFFFTGAILGVQGLWAGPYLFDVLGLSRIDAGNVLLLLGGGTTAGYAASGWLSDRLGVTRVIVATAALFALCQFALALRPPLAVVAPVYFAYGLTGGFCIMMMAHARLIFPPAITGQAVAATNFFGIGGSFCVQWWMGLIIKRFGAGAGGHYPPAAYTAAFLFIALGTTLTLLWYLPLALEAARERRAALQGDARGNATL